MHLLLGCVDLLSTTGKMVSDGMLLMQKDPTLGIPTLRKFLCILLEIAAICSKKMHYVVACMIFKRLHYHGNRPQIGENCN